VTRHRTLTNAAVRRLRPTAKRRFIRDAGAQSLFLVIQPSGRKNWMMRFRQPGGKVGKIVLGPVDTSGREGSGEPPVIGQPLSLVSARRLAADVHDQRARGRDPIADHRARKHRQRVEVANRAANSFPAAAIAFINEHARRRTKRWREAARVLGYVYPVGGGEPTLARGGLAQRWADRAVGDVDDSDVHAVVEEAHRSGVPGRPARNRGPSDARARATLRVLSKFFSWLLRARRVAANPCVGVFSPPPARPRKRVLSAREVAALWRAADRVGGPSSGVVKLLLLTGCRLREVSELRWSEVADDRRSITINGDRTKNHREHVVPLAPDARAIIRSQPRVEGCEFVFTTTGKSPVGGWTWRKRALDALMPNGTPPWVIHDLRRTCITGMGELRVRPDVIELIVNHAGGHRAGVAGTYNLSEMMDERRKALARWAVHVRAIVNKRGRS
jgi:integrase